MSNTASIGKYSSDKTLHCDFTRILCFYQHIIERIYYMSPGDICFVVFIETPYATKYMEWSSHSLFLPRICLKHTCKDFAEIECMYRKILVGSQGYISSIIGCGGENEQTECYVFQRTKAEMQNHETTACCFRWRAAFTRRRTCSGPFTTVPAVLVKQGRSQRRGREVARLGKLPRARVVKYV